MVSRLLSARPLHQQGDGAVLGEMASEQNPCGSHRVVGVDVWGEGAHPGALGRALRDGVRDGERCVGTEQSGAQSAAFGFG